MDDTPILPHGRSGEFCSQCGKALGKCAQDKTRARKYNWRMYCTIGCFRASQTKHFGLTPKERQKRYDKANMERKRKKREAAKRANAHPRPAP